MDRCVISKKLDLGDVQEKSKLILFQVANICETLGLRYYLALGTLLGAVRHGGFIPWDDDIDIMMPRDDYNILIKYFKDNEKMLFPLKLFSPEISSYPYMICRISNINYVLNFDNEKPYGLGLFIDIYPLDGIGHTEEEALRRNKKAARYTSLCYLSTREKCKRERTNSILKLIIKYPAFCISKLLGKKYFFRKLNEMSSEISYDSANYIGCLVWGTASLKRAFPKKWFDSSSELMFEGTMLKVPIEYDKVLNKIYGDYMTLPPEEKRISHHFYEAYEK